ncbi:hypothetical protein QHH11_09920 [Aphanizomenon sp. PH219]|nr:hypothetical protein [Aphanizomenon sp. 202]MDK2459448.1 hypothetical protein [Aphanizomenon sp. PH219]
MLVITLNLLQTVNQVGNRQELITQNRGELLVYKKNQYHISHS